jgi:DNA (cytosine-5)-methyltransferase 1
VTKAEVASLVRRIRLKRGVSRKALADQLGVSVSAVSRWETGASSPNQANAAHLHGWIQEADSGVHSRSDGGYLPNSSTIGLFAGCGGLDLGFQREGFRSVWANEFNADAAETFRHNFPGTAVDQRSISDIDPYSDPRIPKADLILGGFPCQDFSMIWKRPGLDGERGNLYKEFLRFVDAKKPKAFVAENVKGLISANQKRALDQIITDFAAIEPGYLVHVKLFNFADYGVPQFRERVIIVGIRIDTGFAYSFPEPTHGPKADMPYFTAGEALKDVTGAEFNSEHMNITPRTVELLKLIPEGGNFTDVPKEHPLYVKGMISHVYRRINRNEPAKTIIAAGGGGTWGYHYPEPRALTNRERARLQSFPDEFRFSGSFTEVRRQIGNAVPPGGAQAVAKSLAPLFIGGYAKADLSEAAKRENAKPVASRIQRDENRPSKQQMLL